MRRLAVLALALAAAPAALAGSAADPGVTSKQILLGGIAPLTGPASPFASVAVGAGAYFKYVNARGGVNGRTIAYRYYDDKYFDLNQTVLLTRQLVEQDRVFAIFNQVGTANTEAVKSYLNAAKVPQLFPGTGIAVDPKQAKWTLPFLPSFEAEGKIHGRLIRANVKGPKVGVLYESSDFGKNLLDGLRKGLGSGAGSIVGTQSYELTDTSLESQIAQLKSAGANTVCLFATPIAAIQAYTAIHKLGWRPKLYLASVSPSPSVMQIISANAKELANGTTTVAFVKDPTNPRWAKDPVVKLYRQILKRYLPGKPAADVYLYYGMAVAYTMVDALRHAGRNPTRASLLNAATHLNETNPFLFPGIKVQTSPTDYFPLEKAYIVRFANGRWNQIGKLVPASE